MSFTSLRTTTSASLLLTVLLIPHPTSAHPVAPFKFTLAVRQNTSAPIDHHAIFDIAFFLAFVIALLGSFAWVTSRWASGAQPAEFFHRHFAAFSRQLSVFGHSAFVERVSATILDTSNANGAFIPRRGGASYPVATVPGGLQAGGSRRIGVTRGSAGVVTA